MFFKPWFIIFIEVITITYWIENKSDGFRVVISEYNISEQKIW